MSNQDIARLESEVAAQRQRLEDAENQLLAARLAAAPVKVGDIVQCLRTGALVRVSAVDPCLPKPWVAGNPKRKNGEWSLREHNLYSQWKIARDDR
jgi:hypothetical protein